MPAHPYFFYIVPKTILKKIKMENLSGITGLRIVWIYFYNGGMSAVQRLQVNCLF